MENKKYLIIGIVFFVLAIGLGIVSSTGYNISSGFQYNNVVHRQAKENAEWEGQKEVEI
jgi:hypothetical protein